VVTGAGRLAPHNGHRGPVDRGSESAAGMYLLPVGLVVVSA
jgi:hypothetical protein